jgi:hypothetical protein
MIRNRALTGLPRGESIRLLSHAPVTCSTLTARVACAKPTGAAEPTPLLGMAVFGVTD